MAAVALAMGIGSITFGQEARVRAGGAVWQLASATAGPFHATANAIVNARTLGIPDSDGCAVLWTECGPDGVTQQYYAISLDGRTFSRAFPTTNQIQLRYARFDPLADEAPAVPAVLQTDAADTMYIVQFHTQALAAFQRALTDAGASIHAFLPEHAVMAEMPPAVRDAVAQFPFVRSVGPLHPAYKLDESILAALAVNPDDQTLADYSIMVFGRGLDRQQPIVDYILSSGVGAVINVAPDGFRMTATLTLPQVLAIARMNQTHFIEPWGPGEADMQLILALSGGAEMHALGFRGQGVRGEIFDSGVQSDHPEWNGQPPLYHKSPGTPDSHGTASYGICFATGVVMPQAMGLCPEREQGISLYYSHSTQFAGTYTPLTLNTEATDPNGPFRSLFQTSSVGSPRTQLYTTISAETDDCLFRVDYLTCQALSNASLAPETRPQAWAKNIVGIGGIVHNNTLTRDDDYCDGSTGPASDGRIKPELAHAYGGVYTTYSSTGGYGLYGGSSAGTPVSAGHFGLLFQLWHEGVFPGHGGGPTAFDDRPKSTTAKALMINTAYRYNWHVAGPNSNMWRDRQGWGMPDLGRLYANRDKMVIIDEQDLLTPLTFKRYEFFLPAGDPEPELAVTLVYRDPAGNPANQTQHRINDLSLRVVSPAAVEYWGNNGLRDDNWSTPGGAPNTKDTTENVFIQNPQPGVWVVEVHAHELIQDAHLATPELDAAYGLVIRGVRRTILGDLNCDGKVDFGDINPFVLALTNPAQYAVVFPNCWIFNGDINGDGRVDFGDINPFVRLLTNP